MDSHLHGSDEGEPSELLRKYIQYMTPYWWLLLSMTTIALQGCGENAASVSEAQSSSSARAPQSSVAILSSSSASLSSSSWDGVCSSCDSYAPAIPVVTETGGSGGITSYGDGTNPKPSEGGACNYGKTNIMNFAAASVNIEPGDLRGLWNGGHICGQCVQVRVSSPTGWKQVIVRLVDRCFDAYCGIDLGGAPTATLMGSKPGRYAGEWSMVSCDSAPGVSDGATNITVKDGSNASWSLIQVRNPPAAVLGIQWIRPSDGSTGSLPWATEAENFYSVPTSLLQSSDSIWWHISYWTGDMDSILLPGNAFDSAGASWNL